MSTSSILNKAANLLFGYRPVWDPSADDVPAPFFVPPVSALAAVQVDPVTVDYPDWDVYPTITIHDSAESLLSAIYAYQVARLSAEPAGVQIPAGPLALDDADRSAALAAAGAFLGLNLSAGRSYLLVTVRRVSANITHPFSAAPSSVNRTDYLSDAAKQVIAALPPAPQPVDGSPLFDSRIDKNDAIRYLDAIGQLGTHFASAATLGDLLLQVFAYDAQAFQVVRKAFDDSATSQPDGSRAVKGITANGFVYWTSPVSGSFGFTAAYGSLTCLSRDPQLATMISNGLWKESHVPDGTPSIFAFTKQYALVNGLTRQIPIALTLTPIAALIPDPLVAGPWNRIVKGGLLQKWGGAINVPLIREVDYDWSTLFPEAVESWVSGIVTPTVDVYQERVDLAKVQLMGGDLVAQSFQAQSFTSFSQILEASAQLGDGPIDLPSDKITLVAQIVDTSRAAQTPVLRMSDKALDGLTVVCEQMYGSLVFQSGDGSSARRKVALDAILFETLAVDPGTGRATVGIADVLADAPSADMVQSLKQSIELSLVAGESLLHARGPNAQTIRNLEGDYLRWLAGIIPADTTDPDLAYNRARALYLAEDVATFGTDVVYVPYVTYESYNKYVQDMVTEAQSLASTITTYQIQISDTVNSYKIMNSIANLNDNVKQIGGVLTNYFGVLANGRAAMDGYYQQVLDALDREQQKTLADIATLTGKLADQRAVISNVGDPPGIVQTFQKDYADYAKDLVAQCVVSAVEGLFAAGLSMAAIPGEAEGGILKALTAIKDAYEKIKAVTEVLNSLQDAFDTVGKVGDLNALSGTIDETSAAGNLKMPTQLDFQALAENVKAALANVPDSGSLNQDKANLIAAVNTLSDIGSALLQARAKASQTAVEIANQNRLKTINTAQQADLSSLTGKLHLNDSARAPDIANIDLIGITGRLQYQLKQVLSVLARTLELQDGAVQYQYFGMPAAISSFTLQNLLGVISAQDSNVINALQHLDPQPQAVPDPIKVVVADVRASRLTGTNVFRFAIQLADTAFYNYDMVRIRRVVPRISGIQGSDSGKYEVFLSCQAKPFQDRDYTRQPRTFASARRDFGPYVFDVQTGKAEFGDDAGTFDAQVTHLTPFAVWEISLPGDRLSNQGLKTDLLVDVDLDFWITAHFDDPRRPAVGGRVMRRAAMPMAVVADPSRPSLANLEAQMYQNQAVLQKWDAVFNVLVGPVNAFLYQQFQQYVKQLDPKNNDRLMAISAYYCEDVAQFRGFWFTNVTKLSIKLSNPLLKFIPGNDSVTVVQNILSGTLQTGTLAVTQTGFIPGNCRLVDEPVHFTAAPANGTLTLSIDSVFSSNMQVMVSSTGTLPTGLKPDTDYWVVNWASSSGKTSLQLAATTGGTPIVLSDAGNGTHTIYADIEWSSPMTVDTSQNPYVKGSVPLSSISGLVKPPPGRGTDKDTHTVILDFPKGAFTLNKFSVNPPNWDPNHHATAISAALGDFFASNEIKYQVQTINYANLSGDAALQPTNFVLNALTTNAGNNVLQMLIATTGQVQHAHTITLNEPIPYDPVNPIPGQSDFSASLMLGTRLMFEHVFVSSFNQGGTNLQVQAVDPGQDFQAWSAKVTQGGATGDVPFNDKYTIDNTDYHFRISASGNSLTWDLTGMTFTRSETAGIALAYSNGTASPPSGGTVVNFQYQYWVPPYSGDRVYRPGYWTTPWKDASAVAYITMTGGYPLEVSGSGRDQVIKFANIEPSVTFDKSSDLTPTAPSKCDDNDVKIALLNGLGASVPATLKAYMDKITFKPISVFALESLLFPAEQLINLKEARVPGDLLVVGSFLGAVRKKAAAYNVTISAASGAKGEFGTTAFQNGVGTGSATVPNLPKSFVFKYGPINPALGGLVQYTVDIEAGTVSPNNLMLVVDQPDPDNNPGQVILLPPGFGVDQD